MFAKRFIRDATLVFVVSAAIASFLVVAAQGVGRRPRAMAPVTVRLDGLHDRVIPPGAVPVPPSAEGVSAMSWRGLRTAVQGRQVAIEARAYTHDISGAHRYVWSLRVHGVRADRKALVLLKERHYVEQAMTLAAGQSEAEPRFAETLELPPGVYRVTVYLYAVRPDFDFGRSGPGEDLHMKTAGAAGNSEWITVTK